MGIVEVLLARIASSRSTPARASKMPVLIASFSVTASITTSQSASGAGLVDVLRSEAIQADRVDLARSEPAGRLDSVLLDQVLAYGVGLLLGQDLGKVDDVVIVGEGGDDDLRLWLAGLLAPAPDLVEVGAADGGQDGAPRFEQFLIPEQAAVSPRARLEQDLLTLEEGSRVKIAGQRPGSLERCEVVFHGPQGVLAPTGRGHQALVGGLITDQ